MMVLKRWECGILACPVFKMDIDHPALPIINPKLQYLRAGAQQL